MFMDDFNEVLSGDEHVSQRRHRPNWQMENFRQVVNDCGMIDVGYSGNSHGAVENLSTNTSDHLPILLSWGEQTAGQNKQKLWFRFVRGWCLYESSKEVARIAWDKRKEIDPGLTVFGSIRDCRLDLLKWKSETLVKVHSTIKEKEEALDTLQQGMISIASKERATVLSKEIDKLRKADEIYWCQRLRDLCRVKGDRNTDFSHVVSTDRKGKKVKQCLLSMHGTKAPGPDGMPALFFVALLGHSG
ncbi:hypothetical protein LIER_38527 [Lithospermum erythrorhizon]|uniref:Endonuclease/exonuclease/phosphatase n=1 Tax=Lithospermum erythrorhizon TaxID=34254 RepID=A0AAV3Q3R6_LITER